MARGALGAAMAAALLAVAAPGALADSTASSNWSGYAIHRTGTSFRDATARWQVPRVSCQPGQPTYSAMWVGLGGYSPSSEALEQTGTESDCTRAGKAVYSAWWEIVPNPSFGTSLSVQPGAQMRADVSVRSGRVTLTLADLTTHRTFRRTLSASVLDTSSADWIVEAPSRCTDQGSCQTLPLADFGSAEFTSVRATSASGRTGSIASRWWKATSITLQAGGRQFVSSSGSAGAVAQPSSPSAGGSAFRVSYVQSSQPGTNYRAAQGPLRHLPRQ